MAKLVSDQVEYYMPKVTLVLDDSDVGQMLDGLRERMEDWRYTAKCLRGGPVDTDRNFLECSDATEAKWIADYYQRIIREITRQRDRQEKMR
jgi:hypothetical protein